MGYKLLGYAVWRGARWYLRRRMPDLGRKLAIGALGVAALGGAAVAARQALGD